MLSFVIILTKIEHGYKIYYGILLDRGHTKMCLWCVCVGGGGVQQKLGSEKNWFRFVQDVSKEVRGVWDLRVLMLRPWLKVFKLCRYPLL